jgi:nucleoid-associated protein YgaU
LRAELNVSFVEEDALLIQAAKAQQESPDLTHYRMVKQGDQLPLMCNEIYGSPSYYPLVAKANKLKDFRNLIPGQEIYFPPIEK